MRPPARLFFEWCSPSDRACARLLSWIATGRPAGPPTSALIAERFVRRHGRGATRAIVRHDRRPRLPRARAGAVKVRAVVSLTHRTRSAASGRRSPGRPPASAGTRRAGGHEEAPALTFVAERQSCWRSRATSLLLLSCGALNSAMCGGPGRGQISLRLSGSVAGEGAR